MQISALRKALGDDRSIILTVSGRGYRFTAPVGHDDGSATPPSAAPQPSERHALNARLGQKKSIGLWSLAFVVALALAAIPLLRHYWPPRNTSSARVGSPK